MPPAEASLEALVPLPPAPGGASASEATVAGSSFAACAIMSVDCLSLPMAENVRARLTMMMACVDVPAEPRDAVASTLRTAR